MTPGRRPGAAWLPLGALLLLAPTARADTLRDAFEQGTFELRWSASSAVSGDVAKLWVWTGFAL